VRAIRQVHCLMYAAFGLVDAGLRFCRWQPATAPQDDGDSEHDGCGHGRGAEAATTPMLRGVWHCVCSDSCGPRWLQCERGGLQLFCHGEPLRGGNGFELLVLALQLVKGLPVRGRGVIPLQPSGDFFWREIVFGQPQQPFSGLLDQVRQLAVIGLWLDVDGIAHAGRSCCCSSPRQCANARTMYSRTMRSLSFILTAISWVERSI
jgi:hypothetical protein